MDHLPKIKIPKVGRPKIPYLCEDQPYDGQGFSDFPRRMGWKILALEMGKQRLVRSNGSESSRIEEESFLQAWLFFGLLHEIFQIAGLIVTQPADFIVERNGQKYLSTHRLPGYLEKWGEAERSLSDEIQKTHLARTLGCLEEASKFAANNFQSMNLHGSQDEDLTKFLAELYPPQLYSADLSLCLSVLGQTLVNMLSVVWENEPISAPAFASIQCYQITAPPMKTAGWCPSEIGMLHSGMMNVTSLHLAGTLYRPGRQNGHEACTSVSCVASQVDDRNYQTKHVTEGCECEFIVVEQNKVSAILRRGGIPSIVISSQGTPDNISIQVVESQYYIALSHVWSHGLGNPTANALPKCQLLRLRKLVAARCHTSAYPRWRDADNPLVGRRFHSAQPFTLPFWLDTLCVPVQEEFRPDRQLALIKMRDTYSQAKEVLVLDKELQVATRHISKYEKCLRIVLSTWMRRLWTLQEAILDRDKLCFQFLERAVRFWDLYEPVGLQPCVCDDGAFRALSARLLRKDQLDPTSPSRFSRLGIALQYRTTSKPADEAFCIATLLALEVEELSKTKSAEERMKLVLMKIRDLSPRLPFVLGSKLKETNFTWAVNSFLNHNITIARLLPKDGDAIATCDADGFHAEYAGCILSPTGNALTPRAEVIDVITVEDGERNWMYRSLFQAETGAKLCHQVQDAERPAVIYGFDKAAVIVSIEKPKGGTIYANYIGVVERTLVGETEGFLELVGMPLFVCNELPQNQKWCIR